jgi:hypothetical protein
MINIFHSFVSYISFILAIKSSMDNSSSRVVLAADVSLSDVSICGSHFAFGTY